MMRRLVVFLPAAAVLAATALAAPRAGAVPRYSARYEQNCNLCHENPTGGGIRSTYASQFLVPAELSAKKYSEEEMAGISPQLNNVVTLGLDWRTQFHWEHDRLDREIFETSYHNFFQMEGNVYLSVQLDPRFSAHVTRGMSSTTEIYGLGYVLPGSGYLKVGRFAPPYGWKFDDHTAFVRSAPDFGPPANYDVGIEAGFHPGRFQLVGSVMNGERNATTDSDRRRAYGGYGLYRTKLGGVGLGLGGSVLWNDQDTRELLKGGPLWYLKAGRFTWTGEADWARNEHAGGADSTSWVTSNEFCWTAARGVDLLATYDFFDPDTDLRSGTRVRYGAGLEVTPRPFLMLRAMVTMYRPDVGPGLAGLGVETDDFNQAEMQVHLFY